MRYFLFLLFFVITMSKKFSLQLINTPIFSSIPISLFHIVVLFQDNDFENINKHNNYIFAIDFSPNQNISSPNVILNLLLGKTIQGKIRVSCFSKGLCKTVYREPLTNILYSTKNDFFENVDSQITLKNLKKLEDIHPNFVSIIKSWDLSFQIYKRNCRHFSKFLLKHYL